MGKCYLARAGGVSVCACSGGGEGRQLTQYFCMDGAVLCFQNNQSILTVTRS